MNPHILPHAPIVEHALDETLAALTAPVSTRTIANRLLEKLVTAGVRTVTPADLMQHLASLTKTHPNATHDGETFRSYGHAARHWRWHPTAQRRHVLPKEPEPTMAERLTEFERRLRALESFLANHGQDPHASPGNGGLCASPEAGVGLDTPEVGVSSSDLSDIL